jgi:hypothetical protein
MFAEEIVHEFVHSFRIMETLEDLAARRFFVSYFGTSFVRLFLSFPSLVFGGSIRFPNPPTSEMFNLCSFSILICSLG